MNKLTTIFGATLLTVTFNAQAGDCPALAGKYTIGKHDADFSTVNDAVKALNCGGVSGQVTFLMEDGTYSEKIVMSTIEGANAFNTVSFESKSADNGKVMITHSGSDATVVLNGTNWVTFENISIDHKNGTYGNAMRVDGKAGHLAFKAVVFDGVDESRGGEENAVVHFTSNAAKTDIAFQDCEINNGSIGIVKGGMSADATDSKTSITSTLFFNQYETALAITNENAPVINNNVINTITSNAAFKAISLSNCVNGLVVSNNIINNTNGAYGIMMFNCSAPMADLGQISNNSVTVGGAKEAYGLYVGGKTENMVFNFNRVKLNIVGQQTKTQAYYRNMSTGNNINMSNNIFYDLTTGDYTIIGNTYKDMFNQLPGQGNAMMTASANGLMIEKVSPIK